MKEKKDDNNRIDLDLIRELRTPIRKEIFMFMPKNIQLRLAKYSKKVQSDINISYVHYKIYHFLQRDMPLEINIYLKNMCKVIKTHHIDFNVTELKKASFFPKVISICSRYPTIHEKEILETIPIYLKDNTLEYLMLNTNQDYLLFDKYHSFFTKTKLILRDYDPLIDNILTLLKKHPSFVDNVIYINSPWNGYVELDAHFPNLQFYLITSSCHSSTINFFNSHNHQLLFLIMEIDNNSDSVPFLQLDNITHLVLSTSMDIVYFTIKLVNVQSLSLLSMVIRNSKYSIPSDLFPNLEYLYCANCSINQDEGIIDFPKLKSFRIKNNQSTQLEIITYSCLEYLKSIALGNTAVISYREDPINLKTIKLNTSLNVNPHFNNLTHLKIYISNSNQYNIKDLMEKVASNLIVLDVEFCIENQVKIIDDFFYYPMFSLEKFIIILPIHYEEYTYKLIKKQVTIPNLRTISIVFPSNGPEIASENIIQDLNKYDLNNLEVLVINGMVDSLNFAVTKDLPSIKKLIFKQKNINDVIIDDYEPVNCFLKNYRPYLETFSINNQRFLPYADYSIIKSQKLHSYIIPDTTNQANNYYLNKKSTIFQNLLYKDVSCIIF